MRTYSATDNGQAVTILLEDGRCKVDINQLESLLRKDNRTAMAAVLREDEHIKESIKRCATCTMNIGCYECTHREDCVKSKSDEIRYCRECVMRDNRFCRDCKDYLCPACFEQGVFHSCEDCHKLECRFNGCGTSFQYGDAWNVDERSVILALSKVEAG